MRVTPKPIDVLEWTGSNTAQLRTQLNTFYGADLQIQAQNDPNNPNVFMMDEERSLYITLQADSPVILLTKGQPELRSADFVTQWYDTVPD